MNFPRYETERDECLNYINKVINKDYRPYNYFGAFEKNNIISIYMSNNHHMLKFETYKKEENKVKLIKSFYLIKPYKMTVNQYDFINDEIYINVLGLNLTEGNFLGTTILGGKI